MNSSNSSPAFGPVVSAQWLQQQLNPGTGQNGSAANAQPPLVVVDCSFDLTNPDAGQAQFEQAHIPGARYAHLDRHLSAAKGGAVQALAIKGGPVATQASGGRHPLPVREDFAKTLAACGITPNCQVVVMDRNANMYGGRLWWMLKWCGHDQVAVLDGGWQAWLAIGGPVESGPDLHGNDCEGEIPPPYPLAAPLVALRTVDQVAQQLGSPQQVIVDARAHARYTGAIEPLDPAAGHIPGALNRPFAHNFSEDGRYKPAATLQAEWAQLLDGKDPQHVVMHCGSGVTAVPNIIAMVLAGYPAPALFAGSWSEWCSDAARPVATGESPG